MKKTDEVPTKQSDDLELLVQKLRWLRLPGMAKMVDSIVERAAKENLSTTDVVHRLCDEEKQSRIKSAVDRRLRDARFPEINTVDAFNFDFDPARKKLRARYLALHDLDFLEKGINPLFIGTPGTGKTFLARALAYKACLATSRVVCVSAPRMLSELHGAAIHGALERALRRFVRAELLVIDDFAVLAMDAAQAKLAFQVISERYDYRRATCITTNRPFKEWPKSFPTRSTLRSSPNGSPSAPNTSSSRRVSEFRAPEPCPRPHRREPRTPERFERQASRAHVAVPAASRSARAAAGGLR